ncbi:MAG: HEAT repeat domain-containing protein [Candidatus Latescibacterota bacterium]|jgi:hypothetical protein
MSKRTAVAGFVVGVSVLAAVPVLGSQIEDAVENMDEGTVRMTFAARDGVCGNGRSSISFDGGHSWQTHHWDGDDDWERDCDEGPVRVVMKVRDGEVIRLKTRVGGRWRSDGEGVVDLGEVAPGDAADFLLGIAGRSRQPAAEDALLPAVLARDAVVWRRVLDIARDRDRPGDVRETAVFWLGQLAGEKACDGLAQIVEDDDEDMEVREAAIFALSQGDGKRNADYLMRIARTNRHPQLRKSAIFWLAQCDDPEVLDFFEEILLGN